jgi:hypothetical protein
MLAALKQQERMIEVDGMLKRAYTVDEVFARIDQRLTEAFGEKYTERLNLHQAQVIF